MSEDVIKAIFHVVGFVIVLFTLKSLYRVIRLEITGIKVYAKIMGREILEVPNSPLIVLDLIEFKTINNEVIKVKKRYQLSIIHNENQIPVLYDVHNPENYVINTFMDKYLVIMCFLSIGTMFLVVG